MGRVRQRQDRGQGLRGPIRRGRSVLAHVAVQPDQQPHGHPQLDRPERRRQDSEPGPVGAVRGNRSGQRQLRIAGYGRQTGPEPAARQELGCYELTAQQEISSRIQVFGGYYRRHFYDLAWTDNQATANFVDANNPGDWIPFTYHRPGGPQPSERGQRSDHDVQPPPRQDSGGESRDGGTRPMPRTTSAPTTGSKPAPTSSCREAGSRWPASRAARRTSAIAPSTIRTASGSAIFLRSPSATSSSSRPASR